MASIIQDEPAPANTLPHHDSFISNEKMPVDSKSSSVDIVDEKAVDDGSFISGEDEKPKYRNGEPVITTGKDVSRFAVDVRDDGDQALTFRSIVLGTLFAGLGAALCQVSPLRCDIIAPLIAVNV